MTREGVRVVGGLGHFPPPPVGFAWSRVVLPRGGIGRFATFWRSDKLLPHDEVFRSSICCLHLPAWLKLSVAHAGAFIFVQIFFVFQMKGSQKWNKQPALASKRHSHGLPPSPARQGLFKAWTQERVG